MTTFFCVHTYPLEDAPENFCGGLVFVLQGHIKIPCWITGFPSGNSLTKHYENKFGI